MNDPKFVPVDLTMLQDEGVLMAANQFFFWPLGLALAWEHDPELADVASNLHVREWQYEDGHHEIIELHADDEIGSRRRTRFGEWINARIKTLPTGERWRAEDIDDYLVSLG